MHMSLSKETYETLFKDVAILLNQDTQSAAEIRFNALLSFVSDPDVLSNAYQAYVGNIRSGFAGSAVAFATHIKDPDLLKSELVKQLKSETTSNEQYQSTMKALFNERFDTEQGFLLCMKTSFLSEDVGKVKQAISLSLDALEENAARVSIPALLKTVTSVLDEVDDMDIVGTFIDETISAIVQDASETMEGVHRNVFKEIISARLLAESADESTVKNICEELLYTLSEGSDTAAKTQLNTQLHSIIEKALENVTDTMDLSDMAFLCVSRLDGSIKKAKIKDEAIAKAVDMLLEANFEAIRMETDNEDFLRTQIIDTFSLLSQISEIPVSDRMDLQCDVISALLESMDNCLENTQQAIASGLIDCIETPLLDIQVVNQILLDLAQDDEVCDLDLSRDDLLPLKEVCLSACEQEQFGQVVMAKALINTIRAAVEVEGDDLLSELSHKKNLASLLTLNIQTSDREDIISSRLEKVRLERKLINFVTPYKSLLAS